VTYIQSLLALQNDGTVNSSLILRPNAGKTDIQPQ
jgi:hypothetical protein